jgi:hypothetical protein
MHTEQISYNKETKRNKSLDYIRLKADYTGRLNYIIDIENSSLQNISLTINYIQNIE